MFKKCFKISMRLYGYHILDIILSILLAIPLRSLAENRPVVFSTITAVLYIMMLYAMAWRVGYRDARKIPGYYPDRRVPLTTSIMLSVVPIGLFAYRMMCQTFVPEEHYLSLLINGGHSFLLPNNYMSGVADFIYKLWFFPFEAFLRSNMTSIFILMLLVLPAIVFIAYETGVRRFLIFENIMFKINKEEEE